MSDCQSCTGAAGDGRTVIMDLEAVTVSELWMVFEQVLREVHP